MTNPDFLCGFPVKAKIGEGVFGMVYSVDWPKHTSEGELSISQKEGKEIVLKKIKKDSVHSSNIFTELHLLSIINHEYCMKSEEIKIEDDGSVCIIMEKMDIDLLHFLIKYDMTDPLRFTLAYKLIEGLNYLHKNNIIHQDLHPGNILINTKTQHPRITDYGLSKIYETKPFYTKTVLNPLFRPPELLILNLTDVGPKKNCTYQYGSEIDVWTLGLIIYMIFTKEYLATIDYNSPIIILSEIDIIIGLTPDQKLVLENYLNDIPSKEETLQIFKNIDNRIIYTGLRKPKIVRVNRYNLPENKIKTIVDYLQKNEDTIITREKILKDVKYIDKLKDKTYKDEIRKTTINRLDPLIIEFIKIFLNPEPETRLSTKEIIKLLPSEIKNNTVSKIIYPVQIIQYNSSFNSENRIIIVKLLKMLYDNKIINSEILIHTLDLMDRVLSVTYNNEINFYLIAIICLNIILYIMDNPLTISYYIDFLEKMTPLNNLTPEIFLSTQNIIMKRLNFILYRPCLSFLTSANEKLMLNIYMKNLSPSDVNI